MNLRSILTIGVIAAAGLSPAIAQQQGKTRAQVRAELAEALRTGQLLAPGESGLTQQQLRPDLFPSIAMHPGRSRQEVRDELAEAQRRGDLIAGGESSLTLRQRFPASYQDVMSMPTMARRAD